MMSFNGESPLAGQPDATTIMDAMVHTVAYADIFDYPVTSAELHRYLKGVAASAVEVQQILDDGLLVPHRLARKNSYYTLPGRETIIEKRLHREQVAAQLWPAAIRYGRQIAALPFVSMVAVTGSLAVNNAPADADIDYFIVTEPGRVWLCRAMAVMIVRYAARRRVHLCPNYFLSAEKLVFSEQSLYAAHELAQMIPLSGMDVYHEMWVSNDWIYRFLPNAVALNTNSMNLEAPSEPSQSNSANWFMRAAGNGLEWLLSSQLGDWLERWEMNRKINRFTRQMGPGSEAAFCADWCKGHFENHRQRTLNAYTGRVNSLAGQPPEMM